MVWYRQATRHNLNQCRPKSLTPYRVHSAIKCQSVIQYMWAFSIWYQLASTINVYRKQFRSIYGSRIYAIVKKTLPFAVYLPIVDLHYVPRDGKGHSCGCAPPQESILVGIHSSHIYTKRYLFNIFQTLQLDVLVASVLYSSWDHFKLNVVSLASLNNTNHWDTDYYHSLI